MVRRRVCKTHEAAVDATAASVGISALASCQLPVADGSLPVAGCPWLMAAACGCWLFANCQLPTAICFGIGCQGYARLADPAGERRKATGRGNKQRAVSASPNPALIRN
jgi:hypothetical protein